MTREGPCGPVEAFRWMVMWGTCWIEVVAATKADAELLGMAKARVTEPHRISVRRSRPSDDERQAAWKATAEQLGLTDRKAGLGR